MLKIKLATFSVLETFVTQNITVILKIAFYEPFSQVLVNVFSNILLDLNHGPLAKVICSKDL